MGPALRRLDKKRQEKDEDKPCLTGSARQFISLDELGEKRGDGPHRFGVELRVARQEVQVA